MSEKVVIFNFRSLDWSLAASIEIVRRELEANSDIQWAIWESGLDFPREFYLADWLRSLQIRRNILSQKFENLVKSNIETGNLKFLKLHPDPLAQTEVILEKAKFAAYLELISRIREANPNRNYYRLILNKLEISYMKTYVSAKSSFSKEKPNKVYIYNGRFLQERAVADLCKELGISVVYFEKFNPNWKEQYFLFIENTHSPQYRSKLMLDFGNQILDNSMEALVKLGSKWFEDRQKGLTQSFTKNQNRDFLPTSDRPYFVFFHSSEDELITTDLTSRTWGNQTEVLQKIVHLLEEIGTHDLVIRIHPNLRYKSTEEIRLWLTLTKELALKHPWIKSIPPESEVNSYSIIKRSEAVITVGSTIGVEAAFLEKPSLLIGRAFHEDMQITINPANTVELARMLTTKFSQSEMMGRKVNALKYAAFHAHGGVSFRDVLFHSVPRPRYEYMGVNLSNSLLVSISMKIDLAMKRAFNLVLSAIHNRKVA